MTTGSKRSKPKKKVARRREQHLVVADLFLALILCHNVTPVYTPVGDGEETPGEPTQPAEGGASRVTDPEKKLKDEESVPSAQELKKEF